MTSNSLLIVASKGSLFHFDDDEITRSQLRDIFSVCADATCQEDSCLKQLIGKASDVLYVDDFPSTYPTIRSLADAQWYPPRVIGLENHNNEVRVLAGDYVGEWVPEKAVFASLRDGVKNYKNKNIWSVQSPRLTVICLAILLLTIFVHILLSCQGENSNTGYNNDTSFSICARQSARLEMDPHSRYIESR